MLSPFWEFIVFSHLYLHFFSSPSLDLTRYIAITDLFTGPFLTGRHAAVTEGAVDKGVCLHCVCDGGEILCQGYVDVLSVFLSSIVPSQIGLTVALVSSVC